MKFRQCSKCVMDTSDSKISFDSNGVCDHCNIFESKILPKWQFGENQKDQLKKIVSRIKLSNKKNDFDCILGLSGGIDSSYLLHLVVSEFKLRPLVFHVDAGWNSQIANNNIENLVDKLDLDLYTEVIDWGEMKDLQLSFFKSGVPHVDTPQDHAFFATMYKFADKFNIKHILTGGNYSTECTRNPKEWMYYQSDSMQIKDIQKKYGKKKLKNFPITNILWHKVWLPYFRGIKVLRPLDLMPYKKKEALEVLIKLYDYMPYTQKHFESRFTKFYESYWLYERFGFDTRKVQLSSLIQTKQMTKEEAIEILKNKPYDEKNIHKEIEFIANKLGITSEELLMYQKQPKRSYKDFKNIEQIYEFGAYFSKLIGLELGGKR